MEEEEAASQIVHQILLLILKDQKATLESLIERDGAVEDDIRTLAAINEVISYNAIQGD